LQFVELAFVRAVMLIKLQSNYITVYILIMLQSSLIKLILKV